MKNNNLLKILTILIIIAICLISFVGIFVKDKNQMSNLIPDYLLSRNLKGSRVAKLVVSDETEEITYDSEGNVTTDGLDEEGKLKEGYMKKDEKVNPGEVLTKENYELSKKIIEKRLKAYGVQDYTLKQNAENGEITLEILENTKTDIVIYNLEYLGKFTIKDSQTEEVLINSNDVKEAKAVYGTTDSGTTVYLRIDFNKEGKKKLEDVTKTYISTKDEAGNTVTKKVTINLDSEKLIETYFDETNQTGVLQLSIGNATTNSEQISSYIEQASEIAALIDSGVMPIKYKVETNNYLSTGINKDILTISVYILVAIIFIALIYLCVKYKVNGILLSIAYVGYIALLLIVLRYTNVMISLEALVSIVVLLVANYMFIKYALKKTLDKEINKKELIKETYSRYTAILFPLLLISIIFTFIEWIPISSMGMVMFWGLIIMFIYNYVVINVLISKK